MPHMPGHQVDQETQQRLEDCASLCWQSVSYALQKGNRLVQANHMRLLIDCAEICQTGENFMLRGSDFSGRMLALCAETCERCAQSCEQFSDDAQMRSCAEVCRRTAEACRRMPAVA